MIQAQTINNAIVYYADFLFRWILGIGANVVQYILGTGTPTDDTTGDPTNMTVTVVEAGGGGDSTIANSTTAGYKLLLTTDNADYDGLNVQVKGEAFKLESGKPLSFRAKVKISDASATDLLIGLCETKSDLLKTSIAHGLLATNVEGIFFFKANGSTTIKAKSYKDGAEVATADAASAMTTNDTTLDMFWDGSKVEFYLDGTLVTSTTAIPDGDLTPSINLRTGAAAAKTLQVAELSAIQVR